MELWESCGRLGGTLKGTDEERDSTGRPTESTNLDSEGLPETESPSKKQTWARPRPHMHV